MSNRHSRWTYEKRILAGSLLVAAPAFCALAVTFWFVTSDAARALAMLVGIALITLGLAFAMRNRAVYPLYTLANLLEALREGDYSLRGSRASRGDAIGEVVLEVNALSQTLRDQRLSVEEKSALLAKVIATIDIVVLAFDADGRVKLANPAAERLLAMPTTALSAQTAQSLGLGDCLAIADVRLLERRFAGASGRWEIRHARFRENGLPHDLLVISDLGRALREEERLAWQRLLRVLGHELNNSLAPIRSMAGTLANITGREPLAADWRADVHGGLRVIGERAEALARFMSRYTQLARLPPPTPREVDFGVLARRAALLEQRLVVAANGPEMRLRIDPDQLEQALINLIQNASDAALNGDGHVGLDWRHGDGRLLIEVVDDGPGLPPSENLFVPFFTTKPGGSGIGLVLARQIVEAHGGTLTLDNRADMRGCIARILLPA